MIKGGPNLNFDSDGDFVFLWKSDTSGIEEDYEKCLGVKIYIIRVYNAF
jgi:glutamine synthetase adenylyltransferase